MTAFYEKRDLRLLDEKRVREIAREELTKNQKERRDDFIKAASQPVRLGMFD